MKKTLVCKTKKGRVVEIKIELRQKEKGISIDLEPIKGHLELGISGGIWNFKNTDYLCVGQIQGDLRSRLEDKALVFHDESLTEEKLKRLLDIWDRWHLNTLNAGTREQNQKVKERLTEENYTYPGACIVLKNSDLYEDRGCRYGSTWLVELLPEEVIEEIKSW